MATSSNDSFKETTLQLIVQSHIELLLTSPKTGFRSDDEYLALLESIFTIFFLVYDSRETLSRNFLGFLDKVNEDDLKQKRNVYDGLSSLLVQLQNLMTQRLSSNDDPNYYSPRLERLATKLALTDKEKTAFQYIILHNIGIKFPFNQRSYDGRGMLRNMAIIGNMSSREVLNFLSPNRRHMKDGLFEASDDALCFEFSGTTFKMSKETLSAIMGCKLTSEQFLAVDNTTLGELLIEEGVSPTNLPSASSPRHSTVKIEVSDNDNNGDTDQNDDVFALLKTLAIKDEEEDDKEEEDAKAEEKNEISPYLDDLDYLKDHFKVIELRIKAFLSNLEEQDSYKFTTKKSQKTTLRELRSSEKSAYKRCVARIEVTKQSTKNKWLPRLERLVIKRNLDQFEKWVILTLIGCIISVDIIKAAGLQNRYRDAMTVGEMLAANCTDLREQIKHRKYFYRTATLVRENIIKVHESRLLHNSDLMHSYLEIDRRMVDYCVALDTEFGALVEGSSLYTPSVCIDQVVLPTKTKQMILDTLHGMEQFKKTLRGMETLGSDPYAGASYIGHGVVILFHGMSGTGKTMMANAIAKYLDRKILLMNYTKLTLDKTEELMALSLREAKIQNAVIFFDECEALFESRKLGGNKAVNVVLNAIEQYDDIIILATNRPFDLDEAMYRRIQLAVEFPAPDIHLREQIWRQHVPKQVQLAEDVDLYLLSTEYELTGGFIRNAVMSAVKSCLLRNNKSNNKTSNKEDLNLILRQDDLRNACRQQIVGQLQLTGFNRRVIPKKRLSDIELDSRENEILNEIIHNEKSSKVLTGQWGFEAEGQCILISGHSGVGKSTLAEVIAYECGKPMKVLTCSELLHLHRTTFSVKSGTGSDSVFSDLNSSAVLVIEGAEILFRDGYGHDNIINYLLFQIRRVTTMFIFICHGELHSGSIMALSPIQKTLFSHFHAVLKLPKPHKQLKVKLFAKMIPKQTPIDANTVNHKSMLTLADKFPKFVHSDIKRVIIRAASVACLRKHQKERVLTYQDLLEAATKLENELENEGLRLGFHHMYS
eukprot:269781_1